MTPTPPPTDTDALAALKAEAPEVQAALKFQIEGDPRDQELVTQIDDYIERNGLERNVADLTLFAKQFGSNYTYIYRYLNNEFRGNLQKFEDQVRSFFENELLRIVGTQEIVPDGFVVPSVVAFLRQVKALGFIGVGYGPAGKGKTCACRYYASRDKGTVYLHVNAWDGGRIDLTKNLAAAASIKHAQVKPRNSAKAPVRRKGAKMSLSKQLVAKFKGSGRLIILDNAQRLTEAARKWLVDFSDATGTPIALVGNDEVLLSLKKNAQHGSRVGIRMDITDAPQDALEVTARHLIRLHFAEGVDNAKVINEAKSMLVGFGSSRAVTMRARLASEMLKGGRVKNPLEAFTLANCLLVNEAA